MTHGGSFRLGAIALVLTGVGSTASAQAPEVRFGYDARLRYEVYDPTAFGRGPQDDDGYALWRIQPSAEVLRGRWRLYGELFAADVEGREGGPRPNDRNDFDVGQAFVEWSSPERLTVRVGRQEVALGSGRLLAANDGANVRRRFDGVLVSVRRGSDEWIGVASGLVEVRPGVLDDRGSLDRAMVGGGVVRRHDARQLSALYGLYARRPEGLFGSPVDAQERLTLGARAVRTVGASRFEVEAIVQGGEVSGRDVRAWAVAGDWRQPDTAAVGLRPALSLRFSAASGDADASDERVEGFDPLFPNPTYAGSIPLIGPTNTLALNPGLTWRAGPARLGADVAFIRRIERADAVYGFNGAPLGPRGGGSRDVGALWSLTGSVPLREGVAASATLSRLEAGDYLGGVDTTALFVNLTFNR